MNTIMSTYIPPVRPGVRESVIRPLFDVAVAMHRLGYVGPGQRIRFGHDFANACRDRFELKEYEAECLAHDIVTRLFGG